MEQGEASTACVKIAAAAVRAIGIDFAAVDVVRSDGAWKVLEINSGVRMEALGALYPDLVCATYGAALDRIFSQPSH
jgi:glutathione synthase/RimK-type ligase-like ATP-grasp enzyme